MLLKYLMHWILKVGYSSLSGQNKTQGLLTVSVLIKIQNYLNMFKVLGFFSLGYVCKVSIQ